MYKNPAKTLFMGHALVFMPECHSTNEEALRLCRDHHPAEGTVVVTPNQTAGRGLRGNRWITEPGKNLTFSLVLRPQFLAPNNAFDLSRAVSLGIHDYVAGKLDSGTVRIKWPNDIVVRHNKICGMLIENLIAGNKLNFSVCGIGINVNQTEWHFPAASLSAERGSSFDLSSVLEDILLCIEARYLQLRAGHTLRIRADYLDVLYWRGEMHRFREGGDELQGTIQDVDDQGRLILTTAGRERHFAVKEIGYVA